MALTAATEIRSQEMHVRGYLMSVSTTIYRGAMVMLGTDGYLTNADAATTAPFRTMARPNVIGIAMETKTSSNATSDSARTKLRVMSGRAFRIGTSTTTAGHIGDLVYATDENTVNTGHDTSKRPPAGILVERETASIGWVYIPCGGAKQLAIT